MKKKAELTTQQLVILIILIVSFAVILVFLFRMNFKQETDKELCHNSVVMRGKSPLPANTLPLKCNTDYACITEDGSCEKMSNPDIEKVKTKDAIYQILADKMADCWWMFGEGKVEYVEKNYLMSSLYCSICSQVAFDDSILQIKDKEKNEPVFKDNKINKEDFYRYLAAKKIPNKKITYSEYLYGTNNLEAIKDDLKSQGVEFGDIDLNKQQYVVMGITSKISNLGWIAGGALVVGGVAAWVVSGPVGWGLGIGAIGFGAAGGVAGGFAGNLIGIAVKGESGNDFLSPSIIEVDSDAFKSLKCEKISTLA